MNRGWFAERFLAALAAIPDGATPKGIADVAGVDISHGRRKAAVNTLLKHGLVRREGGVYRLTDAGRRHLGKQIRNGPAVGTAGNGKPAVLRRAWRLMRMQRRFSLRDLFEMLDVPKDSTAAARVRKYVGRLMQAGYVKRLGRTERVGGGTWWAVYLLVRDTGPVNPVWRDPHREMYDPNTGEVIRPEATRA